MGQVGCIIITEVSSVVATRKRQTSGARETGTTRDARGGKREYTGLPLRCVCTCMRAWEPPNRLARATKTDSRKKKERDRAGTRERRRELSSESREILCSLRGAKSVGHSGGTRGKDSAHETERGSSKKRILPLLPSLLPPPPFEKAPCIVPWRGMPNRDRKSFTASSVTARAFAYAPGIEGEPHV